MEETNIHPILMFLFRISKKDDPLILRSVNLGSTHNIIIAQDVEGIGNLSYYTEENNYYFFTIIIVDILG